MSQPDEVVEEAFLKVMERLVKKYEQKYRKAREEMDKWDALQLRLLKQFQNAAAIIDRLKVLGDKENYGVLKGFSHITKELPAKQVESLEIIFISMRSNLYLLKVSIISALSYDSRAGDVAALQVVLADQPNIPTSEVQFIFNIIFAEEIS